MEVQEIAEVIRKRLFSYSAAVPREDWDYGVGVALSGGVDSCGVLASLDEFGHDPVVISYTPDTHESTDFKMARATAKRLDLKFVPVLVSMDPDDLEVGVRELCGQGFSTKLEVESMSPMLSILRAAKAAGVNTMFTGDQSDGYFINNNWMARNYDRAQGIPGYLRRPVRDDEDAIRIDILRAIYYDEDRSCSLSIRKLGERAGVDVVVPYRDEEIRLAFKGTHWKEVNEPRLKEPIRLAFKEWFETGMIPVLPKPVNLHRGDSRFAEMLGRAMMSQPHLVGPWRTVTGLYSAIARGEV